MRDEGQAELMLKTQHVDSNAGKSDVRYIPISFSSDMMGRL